MENYILKLLHLTDQNIKVLDVEDFDDKMIVHIEKDHSEKLCPLCNTRMHSKGIVEREVKHPIFQTGKNLVLMVKQRKWKCPNPECNHYCRDQFSFIEPGKQCTNLLPFAILNEMRDIHLSAVQVAKRFNVSDTYVHQTFMKFVDLPRLPLTEAICIDEVHLHFDENNKYALVILDFLSGEIIDILPNRLEQRTNSYFLNIPLEERKKVKYLICDMYKPYIRYTKRYFPNAIPIVDSFHVVQLINSKIQTILNEVRRKLKHEQEKKLEQRNYRHNSAWKSIKESDELYILRKYSWVILKNKDDIKYSFNRSYNKRLRKALDTYEIEQLFFDLDPRFRKMRDLKELYIEFNKSFINDCEGASVRLKEIIKIYENSDIEIFKEIAKTLETYFDEIIASFTYLKGAQRITVNESLTHLSNGLMECKNNVFKDVKRQSRGVSNFDYTRNRILWATRINPAILAVPKTQDRIKRIGKPRGSYKK